MSRADPLTPPLPSAGGALRAALSDLYYNSWRFLGANLLVGLVLIGVGLLAIASLAALVGALLAVPPAAGLMRMATTLQRRGHTDFDEVWSQLRRPRRAMGIGALQLFVLLVLVVDLVVGASISSFFGAFLSASAAWGLLIWWLYALALWPLLLDPVRDGEPVRASLRLAALVLLARPLRMVGLGLLLGALMLVSAITVAPLVTIAIALAWLVAARYVLPLAERVEGRTVADPLDVPTDGWPRA